MQTNLLKCTDTIIDNSIHISSKNLSNNKNYSPKAAYYALPKAFIMHILPLMSGSTTKVFMALTYHTDPFNRIKYPDKISFKSIMQMSGIKKKDTISKAFHEMAKLHIIGGYKPGYGSENTTFYFTFDIDHYKNEKSCLDIEEIDSYYAMLLSRESFTIPSDSDTENESQNEDSNNAPDLITTDSIHEEASLQYVHTITNGWGRDINLFQYKLNEYISSPGEYFLEDGSFFCDENEYSALYKDTSKINPIYKNEEVKRVNSTKELENKQKMGQVYTKKKDTINTIYNSNILILKTQKYINILKNNKFFIHEFNNFCVENSSKYRKNTLFWILNHAVSYNLSAEDIIESIKIANNKGKEGIMSYLIGIMRNKSKNKNLGIEVIGVPKEIQVHDYFQEKFSHVLVYLKMYWFDYEKKIIHYILNNPDADRNAVADYFKIVSDDIQRALGITIHAVENL